MDDEGIDQLAVAVAELQTSLNRADRAMADDLRVGAAVTTEDVALHVLGSGRPS